MLSLPTFRSTSEMWSIIFSFAGSDLYHRVTCRPLSTTFRDALPPPPLWVSYPSSTSGGGGGGSGESLRELFQRLNRGKEKK